MKFSLRIATDSLTVYFSGKFSWQTCQVEHPPDGCSPRKWAGPESEGARSLAAAPTQKKAKRKKMTRTNWALALFIPTKSPNIIICVYVYSYDIWYMINDKWYMIIYEIWYMIYNIWNMIYDIQYLKYDIWHMICMYNIERERERIIHVAICTCSISISGQKKVASNEAAAIWQKPGQMGKVVHPNPTGSGT